MQVHLEIHVFQLSEEGAADDDEPEDDVSTYRDWLLPAQEFHKLWDSLVYEDDIKARLLQYAATVSLTPLNALSSCDKLEAQCILSNELRVCLCAGYLLWREGG